MEAWYDEESLLPLSGIQHFAFCERQWALIHVERQWAENQRTVEGRHLHERAHNPFLSSDERGCLVVRSLPIVSRKLGLYGQADVVEFCPVSPGAGGISLPGRDGHWLPQPVEYKRGKPKTDERDEVQLCAQAICLEEMLDVSIVGGDLYYGETRRRHHVPFTNPLRQRVEELSRGMHEMFDAGRTPPAKKGKQCRSCSLVEECLPNLTRKARSVRGYVHKYVAESAEAGEE